ncbi:MAG: L-threonylcarbamoyladenylate synthase [Bilophila wadsworthia]
MLDGIPSSSRRKPFSLRSRALDADATARIYRAKHAPLSVLCPDSGDWEQLDMIAKVHDELMPLLKRFWPGPLSVIFPARLRVPDILTGGTGRVAVRLSSHPVARALAQAVGEPITSSSANISGNPAVVSVNQLDEELIASVMGILDEPPVPAGGLPSTLVERMEDGRLRLLRAGAVTSAQIAEAGFEVVEEE